MTERRRIEVTFSRKDDDLWEFVNSDEDSPSIFIKKLLRKHLNEELAPEVEEEEHKDEVIEKESKQEETTPESNPIPLNTGFTF